MSIVLNPAASSVAAQGVAAQAFAANGVAGDIVLQPGAVINAQVLQLLGGDQVRIAIDGQPLDVVSQVPLQAGQTLQLSVSQAATGTINLAVVNQAAVAASPADAAAANATSDAAILATLVAPGSVAAPAAAAALQNQLTTLQALAVSVAAETAATQQTSLAPLFANLGVATAAGSLPAPVLQAAAQVLAQRINPDQGLTGDDIRQAFQNSGLFLEASLARGSVTSGTPDLKAALIVLRQALNSAIDVAASAPNAAATTTANAVPLVPSDDPQATTVMAPADAAPATILLEQGVDQRLAVPSSSVIITAEAQPANVSPAPAPLLADMAPSNALPQSAAPEIPQSLLEFSAAASPGLMPATNPADAAARVAASSAALNLLQEVVQADPLATSLAAGNTSRLAFDDSMMLSLLPSAAGVRLPKLGDAEFARTNAPPPPIGGALPAAQPVTQATLVSSASLDTAMHHLLADTDGAIARQTLLQVASLPDQVDPATGRIDSVPPRWNFEIPFVTPQGTAMAQFEISRDGGTASEAEAGNRAWRARFTLDVEPAGPVHALVSLSGDRTSVRMWAERPATADQLRAGVSQLSQALSRAELQPGDIVIRDGAPSQPVLARAGHFLDRAL
ncbi:MAG: flagellar hook-length control protein FliK [Bradyrhizobium sp.]|uniref:flagellar hook-length control protein FliK n=1 Tax=Bradyrhizobium sp. TaxID=376 RepID=UPI001C2943A7|nr:flagellar hook-length control protein FliK [Bradyrhizobium sp.]MBU6463851.1 flagellar hook-length control protein FliK [Pseudomonadota bacterium]MDE2067606.1 flagellar hook-length control protein FliK [Bradyrhizobium sp.]MDE2241973.1 flagellar hook-length control protein FliK [Bradyrhizobium sp.]